MPNICEATILVTGRSECIGEFERILRSTWICGLEKYTYNRNFYRIFEVRSGSLMWIEGLIYTQKFIIKCAWDIPSAMMSNSNNWDGKRNTTTSIEVEAERLQLDIEIWSRIEDGRMQHIHYHNNKLLYNESSGYDYYGTTYYKNYKEFVREHSEMYNVSKEAIKLEVPKKEFKKAKMLGQGIYKYEDPNAFTFKVFGHDPVTSADFINPFSKDKKEMFKKK
jgi:hypothetical protein